MITNNGHPKPQTSSGTDPVDRFVELQRRKRELETELKPIKDELAKLEETVADRFAEQGTEQIKRNGATVYLSRDVTLKAKEGTDAAVRALIDSHPDMLGLGHQKLKALVKESCYDAELDTWEIDPRKLPAEIAKAFEVGEISKARCRFS